LLRAILCLDMDEYLEARLDLDIDDLAVVYFSELRVVVPVLQCLGLLHTTDYHVDSDVDSSYCDVARGGSMVRRLFHNLLCHGHDRWWRRRRRNNCQD
jgi:hypothetical protein